MTSDRSDRDRGEKDPHDMDELLGAYALDAVSDDERRAVDEYLLANPRARAEVQEHREVATMLAWSGMNAPEGLWDRIADNINGPAVGAESELGQVLAMRQSRRKSWVRTGGSWVAATAAAALIAVVAVKVSDDDATTNPTADRYEQIVQDPRTSQAELTSPGDAQLKVRAFIGPDGNGFVYADSLPDLDPSRTYQLWGRFEGRSELISLGVLGAAPGTVDFTVDGPVALLAVTEEVAGGVVSSSNPVVVAGEPA